MEMAQSSIANIKNYDGNAVGCPVLVWSYPYSMPVCVNGDNAEINSSTIATLPLLSSSSSSSPSSVSFASTMTGTDGGDTDRQAFNSNSNLNMNRKPNKNSLKFLPVTHPCPSNIFVLCHLANKHQKPLLQSQNLSSNSVCLQQQIETALNRTASNSSLCMNMQKKELMADADAPNRNLLESLLDAKNKNNNSTIHKQEKNLSVPRMIPCEATDLYAASLLLSLSSQEFNIHVHERSPNGAHGSLKRLSLPTVPIDYTVVTQNRKLKSVANSLMSIDKEKKFTQVNNHSDKYTFLSNSFQCIHCDRIYQSEKGLKRHERVHDPATRGCPYCDKKFARKSYLLDHIHTHTGEKPYSCPSCRKCFACKRNLNQHIRTHSDVKRYCCRWCDRKFRVNQSLKVHLAKVHQYTIK